MQKARGHAAPKGIALPPLVGTGFQVQCPPLIGVLPTVRSPYWVRYRSSCVLSLAGGSPPIQAGFHVPDPTRVPDRRARIVAYGTVTRSGAAFQRTSADARHIPSLRPHDPGWYPTRFRLVPVRSPLLRESRLISLPPGTEMFQFPGSLVSIPGSTLVGQLPRTFRGLPRPPSDDA